jgi:hypothetical protein
VAAAAETDVPLAHVLIYETHAPSIITTPLNRCKDLHCRLEDFTQSRGLAAREDTVGGSMWGGEFRSRSTELVAATTSIL